MMAAEDGGPDGLRFIRELMTCARFASRLAWLQGSYSSPLIVLASLPPSGWIIEHLVAYAAPFGKYAMAQGTPQSRHLNALRDDERSFFWSASPDGPHWFIVLGFAVRRSKPPAGYDWNAVTRALREFLRTFMVKGPDALVHGRVELPFAVETGIMMSHDEELGNESGVRLRSADRADRTRSVHRRVLGEASARCCKAISRLLFEPVLACRHRPDPVLDRPPLSGGSSGQALAGSPTDAYTRDLRSRRFVFAGVSDTDRILLEYQRGATMLLQRLERSWPPLAALCRNLEQVFYHPVDANADLTPASSQGFGSTTTRMTCSSCSLPGRSTGGDTTRRCACPSRANPSISSTSLPESSHSRSTCMPVI